MTEASAAPLTLRRIVSCREYGRIEVEPNQVLAPDGRLRLAAGVLNKYVRADFNDSGVQLWAKGVVGLFPLTDDIALQVRPRFPLRNLTHMVNACGRAPTVLSALREYLPTQQSSDWLLDVLADSLLAGLETIAANGLLRTYVIRTEVSAYPHGRIDTTATVLSQTSRGIDHRAQYSWFERTVDNPPNRCLKGAVAFLYMRYLHAPRRSGVRVRIARLGDAMRMLKNVATEKHPNSVNDPQVRGARLLPVSRAYYRPALDLAVVVLTGRAVNLDEYGLGIRLPSLLVNTEDLFEDYVRLSLQRAFGGDPQLTVLDGSRDPGVLSLYEEVSEERRQDLPDHVSLLDGSAATAEPDIVLRMNGAHPLVADVKYTNVRWHADRSEVEQVVLYGLRYNSPVVMTVHPKRADSTKGLHLSGHIGSLIVMQYRVDLGAEDLEAEMFEMAESLRVLIAGLAASERPS